MPRAVAYEVTVTAAQRTGPECEPPGHPKSAAADVRRLGGAACGCRQGSSAPRVPLAWGGDFTLSVVDEHGASSSRMVRVDPQP
jgi:hypothetical protein